MNTIWKYQLPLEDRFTLKLPKYWDRLSLQMQRGVMTMWAMVNTEAKEVEYTFRVYGTGHEVKDKQKLEYVGTVQDGALVWHVFVEWPK